MGVSPEQNLTGNGRIKSVLRYFRNKSDKDSETYIANLFSKAPENMKIDIRYIDVDHVRAFADICLKYCITSATISQMVSKYKIISSPMKN